MKSLLVAVAVCVVAPAAVASANGAPTGFVSRPALAAKAAYIAGKPVVVYCPTSQAVWNDFLASHSDTADNVEGATITVGGTETYLSVNVCAVMLARIAGKRILLGPLGASIEVLAHESIHLKGESDEGVTDCAAIRALPAYLVARWGFRKGTIPYTRTLAAARKYHAQSPSQYRTVC